MSSIKLLSKQLASQIAAGEVVERPASVVKELLENAVDAGGSNILCEIRNSGKVLIRVRDNGKGIVKDELPLALAPHATSKIYSVEDLSAITTLGFRGEALASIASVSKLVLTSKTAEEENAYCVRVEGPDQHPLIEPAAHPTGTTVDVSELFFNTPARRRFLKSDRTEFARIKDIFTRVALAHPDVGFELVSDGKSLVRVGSAKGEGIDLKRTATLIGADFSVSGMRVISENPSLKIEGMLLPPPREEEALADKIYIFLNGRPLADKLVTHALREGFFEVLGKSLPIRCVIYMQVDPSSVDVNVHPRKDEVRFHETTLIHDLIVDSIVYTLRSNGILSYQQMHNDPLGMSAPEDESLAKISEVEPHQPSPHVATYDINDHRLPEFPSGVSSVIDINSIADRGKPKIIKASEHRDENSYARQSFGGFGVYETNPEQRRHNVNIYQASVASANVSLNARTNVESNYLKGIERSNDIEFIDMLSENSALIKLKGKLYLLNLRVVREILVSDEYQKEVMGNRVERMKMTLPYTLNNVETSLCAALKNCFSALLKCGFVLKASKSRIEILEIPKRLKGANLAAIALGIFSLIAEHSTQIDNGQPPEALATLIGQNMITGINKTDASELISRISDLNRLFEMKHAITELNLEKVIHDFESRV